jgi:opacity protein-like surface antigen
MLRPPVPLLAAVLIALASAANAASVAGTVTAINQSAHTLTLSDDVVYTTSPTMDLNRIQVGYVIKVTFTKEDNINKVSALEILSPPQPTGY